MNYRAVSIRTFIGAKDYDLCRSFYRELGFEEVVIDPTMCLFKTGEHTGFYLQRAYVRDWVDNTMVFLEVDDLDACYKDINAKDLPQKFKGVRLKGIRNEAWGREFFLHDPSGVLWHFGVFNK